MCILASLEKAEQSSKKARKAENLETSEVEITPLRQIKRKNTHRGKKRTQIQKKKRKDSGSESAQSAGIESSDGGSDIDVPATFITSEQGKLSRQIVN